MRGRFALVLLALSTAVATICGPQRVLAGGGVSLSVQQIPRRNTLAMRQVSSVHLSLWLTATVPGKLRQTVHGEADFVTAPPSLREWVSTRTVNLQQPSAPPSILRYYFVLVDGKSAAMLGRGPVQCQTTSTAQQTSQQMGSLVNLQVSTPKLIALELLRGQSVWRLQATTSLALSGRTQQIPTDIYIRLSDYRLVRLTAAPVLRVDGISIHERLIATFSRYNEPVSVSLPAKCQS